MQTLPRMRVSFKDIALLPVTDFQGLSSMTQCLLRRGGTADCQRVSGILVMRNPAEAVSEGVGHRYIMFNNLRAAPTHTPSSK